MITAILAAVVVWCLFCGRIAPLHLALLSAGLGGALACLGRHEHARFFIIDVVAQISRLNRVNATLKFFAALAWMLLCVSAKSPLIGVFLAISVLSLVVCAGGLRLREYVRILALPVSFLLLGVLALLFEVGPQPFGVIRIPVFGAWLCVSVKTQLAAALVMGRALGAVSCLYLLSLTTPMSELIDVLRRVRCPDLLIELMYLIYRYIFILLAMHYAMRDAAKSRLGYVNYRAAVRTTGSLYSSLLSRSYQQAKLNYDAMESRCYDTKIRFLAREKRVTGLHAAIAAGMTAITLAMTLFLPKVMA